MEISWYQYQDMLAHLTHYNGIVIPSQVDFVILYFTGIRYYFLYTSRMCIIILCINKKGSCTIKASDLCLILFLTFLSSYCRHRYSLVYSFDLSFSFSCDCVVMSLSLSRVVYYYSSVPSLIGLLASFTSHSPTQIYSPFLFQYSGFDFALRIHFFAVAWRDPHIASPDFNGSLHFSLNIHGWRSCRI